MILKEAMLHVALILWMVLFQAVDFGVFGNTFNISEPDLLSKIESQLGRYEASGELSKFNERYKKAVKSQIKRPNKVMGIGIATQPSIKKFDPSIILDEDIFLPIDDTGEKFKLAYAAGTKINPLNYMRFTEPLIFIDGDMQNKKSLQ